LVRTYYFSLQGEQCEKQETGMNFLAAWFMLVSSFSDFEYGGNIFL
jgi:hypothetical protein